MKKIIILQTSGNELTNQLWNYASIYAYTLERDYSLENPSFFEYGNYFNMSASNHLFKAFFFNPFTNYTGRKSDFRRKIWRKLYFWYARIILQLFRNNLIAYKDGNNRPYYLPPTKESAGILSRLEKKGGNIYIDSWLFRNPEGLRKYRKEIIKYFRPRPDIVKEVEIQINNLRNRFKNIVGIHIRQGDYKTWRGGACFIPQTRVREIVDEYLKISDQDKRNVCFVITSDEQVDTNLFANLNVFVSKGNAVHDLYILSKTDLIIGSNSTFGAFASYYGDIPFIVMQKTEIDWDYYKNKGTYFENKYSTMVQY